MDPLKLVSSQQSVSVEQLVPLTPMTYGDILADMLLAEILCDTYGNRGAGHANKGGYVLYYDSDAREGDEHRITIVLRGPERRDTHDVRRGAIAALSASPELSQHWRLPVEQALCGVATAKIAREAMMASLENIL